MFSAFLNTVFRKAEKIAKQYKNCFNIIKGSGFLESGARKIAVV